MTTRVLIVDDDVAVRVLVKRFLDTKRLADQRAKLAERLDLLVVLKAVLVAARNANYSSEQALGAIRELVSAVLESDQRDVA